MKKISKSLLLLMLLPVLAFGDSYNYDKVISLNKGSDNFNFDRIKELDNSGNISIENGVINIDGKKYELHAEETTPNMYKSKNCSLEFVYKGGELAMVKMFKYNGVVCYVINPGTSLASNK